VKQRSTMDDIVNTFEDAQYEQAVTADKAPTSPWPTPTPEEAQEFEAKMISLNANFKKKDEVVKNKLGEYLVGELGSEEWEGSAQQTEYMTMQWNRSKKVFPFPTTPSSHGPASLPRRPLIFS